VVGTFLGSIFNKHFLSEHCGESLTRSPSISLHYCPGFSQAQLIYLIVSIYDGVPETFKVFRCRPSSTEEELSLFMKRVAKHSQQYFVLEVNRLPFKLQEVSEYIVNGA